jgi:ABC-type sugar transport system ATPase subunit
MKGISKQFGGIHALKSVDLELRRGEILGIVGDNGAGKSTLMKILSGAYLADEGEIHVDGHRAHIRNPQDAFHLGIGMIYQDLALFDNLDVAQNIFVGRERSRGPLGLFLDKKDMYRKAEELIGDLRVDISSPRLNVARMAALGVTEASKLLSLIRNLRNRGLAILLITQRIPDILAIADRVFVLKGGQRQDVLDVSKVTLDDIVTLIVKGKDRSDESDPNLEYQSFG